MKTGKIISLNKSPKHCLSKQPYASISLLKGLGVEGDVHMGKTVKHRSRVAKDPTQPNFRQIHLIPNELFTELRLLGFEVRAGEMGENITTEGINLLELPKDTILKIGLEAKIKITGLRNPCNQLNSIKSGLMQAVISKDASGNLIRKAGVMGIVIEGGVITLDDHIEIHLPSKPFEKLDKV